MGFAWVTGFGPRVLWDNVARWVDAGRYVTSAGVSAGTDMAFHLVSRLAGRAVAEQAAIGQNMIGTAIRISRIFYPQQAAVPSATGLDIAEPARETAMDMNCFNRG